MDNPRASNPETALSDRDYAAIKELNHRWLEAERAGDWSTIAALSTEDAVWAPPGQPVLQGRQAIRAWGAALHIMPVELAETLVEVDGCNRVAYVRGRFW